MIFRLFTTYEVEAAVAHALSGGIALHIHAVIPDRNKAPKCFVSAVDKGEPICHMFCADRDALVATAKSLGVNVIKIDRDGTDRQHIDLCGGPLKRAFKKLPPEDEMKLSQALEAFKKRKRVA
jgi:hypothetical protein